MASFRLQSDTALLLLSLLLSPAEQRFTVCRSPSNLPHHLYSTLALALMGKHTPSQAASTGSYTGSRREVLGRGSHSKQTNTALKHSGKRRHQDAATEEASRSKRSLRCGESDSQGCHLHRQARTREPVNEHSPSSIAISSHKSVLTGLYGGKDCL